MKNLIRLTAIFSGILFICLTQSCTKNNDDDVIGPKEELIGRYWYINRVQLRLYNGNTFLKDTIIPFNGKPLNYVDFSGNAFKYCFNTASVDAGSYAFKGIDSVIATTPANVYRWKILTLTKQLFTVVSTSSNDPDFPGMKVERYQTWVP